MIFTITGYLKESIGTGAVNGFKKEPPVHTWLRKIFDEPLERLSSVCGYMPLPKATTWPPFSS